MWANDMPTFPTLLSSTCALFRSESLLDNLAIVHHTTWPCVADMEEGHLALPGLDVMNGAKPSDRTAQHVEMHTHPLLAAGFAWLGTEEAWAASRPGSAACLKA